MSSAHNVAGRRGQSYVPISSHGTPKTPYEQDDSIRPPRYSTIVSCSSPSPFGATPPMTPMSPFSPPMSARSFGTFIDSAPSTPAYSPRMGNGWDSSTLMLLSPAVSSAPSSPVEPQWDMLTPPAKSKAGAARAIKPISEEPELEKENLPPREKEQQTDAKSTDAKPKQESGSSTHVPQLGKLATKVKSILRRKTVSERSGDVYESKSGRRHGRRKYQDLDYMEDVHWTEM